MRRPAAILSAALCNDGERMCLEGEIVAELERRVAASRPEIEDFTSPPWVLLSNRRL